MVKSSFASAAVVGLVLWLSDYNSKDIVVGMIGTIAILAIGHAERLEIRLSRLEQHLDRHASLIDRLNERERL